MKNKLVIGIILILVLVVAGFLLNKFVFDKTFIHNENELIFCQSDSDCVPKEACHPKMCVNKEFAENRDGKICSAVCEPGSLDCGQGSCYCINNKCNAVFK